MADEGIGIRTADLLARLFAAEESSEPENRTCVISEVDSQSDWVVLYSTKLKHYHIIAPADCTAKVGDTVEYEYDPQFNFGSFIRVL